MVSEGAQKRSAAQAPSPATRQPRSIQHAGAAQRGPAAAKGRRSRRAAAAASEGAGPYRRAPGHGGFVRRRPAADPQCAALVHSVRLALPARAALSGQRVNPDAEPDEPSGGLPCDRMPDRSRLRGNTVTRSGGGGDIVTGAFLGTRHQAMGGTLQRDDLSAAFGGSR